MKALVSSVLTGFALLLAEPVHALTADEMASQAQNAFGARAYSASGIQKAQEAADLYANLVAQASEPKRKAGYLSKQAEALYFVGSASTSKDTKLDKHQKGFDAAAQAVKLLGVVDVTKVSDSDLAALKALPAADLQMLGEALYLRGTNLGQWGSANGVMESLSKWPELRDTMQLIVNLGMKELREYGAYRTLGRGYFKIPGLLGGSNKKAEKYLSSAVQGSLAPGQVYSTNGHNNIFYAELLKDIGQEEKARELLQAFLKADATALNPAQAVELKQAQLEASELLKSW